jgi:hypothetical protein
MHWHAAGLSRSDRVIWSIIAVVAGIVLLAPLVSRFRLVWGSFLGPGIATAIFLAAQYFYQRHRTDFRLVAGLSGTAQLIAFAAVAAPLSYLAASVDLPFNDRLLDGLDRALGLDWPSWLALMNAHASVHTLAWAIYYSLLPQTAVIVLVLAFSGHLAWLRVYMLAFILTTLATIAAFAIVPSAGVWELLHLGTASNLHIVPAVHGDYLSTLHGLRHGTYRLLIAAGAEGIINFPSLHGALAILFALVLWPVRVLRWIGLALNVAMIFAIPVEGGHYFVDVFAGIAIACISLVVARSIVRRAHATAPATIEPALVVGR